MNTGLCQVCDQNAQHFQFRLLLSSLLLFRTIYCLMTARTDGTRSNSDMILSVNCEAFERVVPRNIKLNLYF